MPNLIDTIKAAWDSVITNNPTTKIRGNALNTELDRLADWLKDRVDATNGSLWLITYIDNPGNLTELTSTGTNDKFMVWDFDAGVWKYLDQSNLPSGNTDMTVTEAPTTITLQAGSGATDTIELADATNAGGYVPDHYNRNARFLNSPGTITSSTTMTADADTALRWKLTLDHTGSLAISNMLDGEVVKIKVVQGSTGGEISSITVNGTACPIQGSFNSGVGEINTVIVDLFDTNDPIANVGL